MGQETLALLQSPPSITHPERCSGCGRCVAICPERLYTLETVGYRKLSVNIYPEKCTFCGQCIEACPLNLLTGQGLIDT